MEKSISDTEESTENGRSDRNLSGILEEWIELLIQYKKVLVQKDLTEKTKG